MNDGMLFQVIVASNFLEIKPLLDLACMKVADEIKDKTPEEIRVRFGLKNDLTPEEDAQIAAENKLISEF